MPVLLLSSMLAVTARGADRQVAAFAVERCAGNPIIRPGMPGLLPERGVDNINGPSLIRVPDWIEKPLGRYYLYFAHHNGSHIRLAYAEAIEGPWQIHAGGVLPLSQTPGRSHVASPDVHVDHELRRIRMYFHAPAPKDSPMKGQLTWAALSADGLDFQVNQEVLGQFYMRVFERQGVFYGLAKNHNDGGILYRSADGLTGFETGPRILPRVRHLALWYDRANDVLYVFLSRGEDNPDRKSVV